MSNSGPVFSPARLLTVGVCVWVLAAVYARPARAEAPLEIELQYTTDPSLPDCPSEMAFRAMVVEQLGYDPVRPTSAHRVLAQAQAGPGMVSGSVRWRHGESSVGGEREISGKTCKELARAMAFAVTVQIQLLVLQKEPLQVNEAPASVEAATDEPLPQTTDAPLAVAVTEEPPSRSPRPEVAPVAPPTQLQPATHLATDPTSVWTSALGVGVGVRLRRKPTATAEGRVFGALFHGLWGES